MSELNKKIQLAAKLLEERSNSEDSKKSKKPVWIYHIITWNDIEKTTRMVKNLYPRVHFYGDETCKIECNFHNRQDTKTNKTNDNGRKQQLQTSEQKQKNDKEQSEQTTTPVHRLCAGKEGTIEFTNEQKGVVGIRWKNDILRMYSTHSGGGVYDNTTDGGNGIHQVGDYCTKTNERISIPFIEPYKMVAVHYDKQQRRRWHIIHITYDQNLEKNTLTGIAVRENNAYMLQNIRCLRCIQQYLYNSEGCQVLQDILTTKQIKSRQCNNHRRGLDIINKTIQIACEIRCNRKIKETYRRKDAKINYMRTHVNVTQNKSIKTYRDKARRTL